MNYFQYERRLRRMVGAATGAARFRFAQDTLLLLRRAASDSIAIHFSAEQQQLLADVLARVNVAATDDLLARLTRIGVSEFCPYVTDLLSALEHWIKYRASRDPEQVVQLAIDMVNMLDYHIGGDMGSYSTDSMLSSQIIREEFHRQKHFLA